MRLYKQTTACCRHGVSMLIAGGVVLMPVSSAYAATIDELVDTVASSTSMTFGVGAAAGAVAAGLVGTIVHVRSKRKYKKRIELLEQDVDSAKASKEDAESRLQVLQAEYDAFQQSIVTETEETESQSEDATEMEMPTEVFQVVEESKEQEEPKDTSEDLDDADAEAVVEESHDDGSAIEDETSITQPMPEVAAQAEGNQVADDQAPEGDSSTTQPMVEAVAQEEDDQVLEDSASEPVEAKETAHADESIPVSYAQKKTVRAILEERLAPDALSKAAGTFGKRTVYSNEIPAFLGHRRARQYDPVVRASLIDQRVPRFDESLFPDVVSHVHNEVDVFEAAMRALEDTLQHTAVLGIEEEEPPLYSESESESRPEMLDAAAYVDYLLQDEIEKTKSGEPLTLNHPHLTMFDGTGDLNASKKLGKHHPDHMRLVQNEG